MNQWNGIFAVVPGLRTFDVYPTFRTFFPEYFRPGFPFRSIPFPVFLKTFCRMGSTKKPIAFKIVFFLFVRFTPAKKFIHFTEDSVKYRIGSLNRVKSNMNDMCQCFSFICCSRLWYSKPANSQGVIYVYLGYRIFMKLCAATVTCTART